MEQEVIMEQEVTYVGIDVAKAQVDVAIRPTNDRWEIPRDEAGIRKLVSQMQTLEPVMVLLEASGGLELPLVAALAAEAVPVVVVNPRQVRDFARATGKLAKTDALDAAVLAHFAEAVQPPVRPLRGTETQVLNSMAARRFEQGHKRFPSARDLPAVGMVALYYIAHGLSSLGCRVKQSI